MFMENYISFIHLWTAVFFRERCLAKIILFISQQMQWQKIVVLQQTSLFFNLVCVCCYSFILHYLCPSRGHDEASQCRPNRDWMWCEVHLPTPHCSASLAVQQLPIPTLSMPHDDRTEVCPNEWTTWFIMRSKQKNVLFFIFLLVFHINSCS